MKYHESSKKQTTRTLLINFSCTLLINFAYPATINDFASNEAINQSWKATIVQGWIHVTQVEPASHRSAGKLSFFAEHVRRRMQKIGERVRARWDGRSVAVIFQIATQSFTPDLLPRGRKRRPPSPPLSSSATTPRHPRIHPTFSLVQGVAAGY